MHIGRTSSNMASEMESWREYLCAEVQGYVKEGIYEWSGVLNELGLEIEYMNEWADIFKSEVRSLLEELLKSVKEKRSDVLEKIDHLKKLLRDVCVQLGVEMPKCDVERQGLYAVERRLIEEVTELQEKVAVRSREVKRLNQKQTDLSRHLGIQPTTLPISPLPSNETLCKYLESIDRLELEHFTRREKFASQKCEIQDMARTVDWRPATSFERTVMNEDERSFVVSDSNMEQLDGLRRRLESRVRQVAEEISELREEVGSMWETLDEDILYRQNFLQRHTGETYATLRALRDEKGRCEELKRQNIETFMKKLRDEISYMWEKCGFTVEQRSEFEHYDDTVFTEDLLALHDAELRKLKKFYSDNEKIFETLNECQELWSKYEDLEKRAEGPDRYKNRGGQLLREEKHRNKVLKSIPKVEAKLKEAAKRFEEEHGAPFTYWGETVEKLIAQHYQLLEENKKQRQTARAQQLSAGKQYLTATPGASALKITPLKVSAVSLYSRSKTPLCDNNLGRTGTPKALFSLSKRGRENRKAVADVHRIQTQKPIMKPKLRYSMEKVNRMRRIRRISQFLKDQAENPDSSMCKMFEGIVPIAETSDIELDE